MTLLFKAMSNWYVPGPRIVFLPALPNWPAAGRTKAAVLNQAMTVGFAINTGAPVAFARSVPFVPRRISPVSPRIRAVDGVPEAIVQLPLTCQLPNIARPKCSVESHRLFSPNGNFQRWSHVKR